MNDRLDDKIRAFVAEVVNDPPATPEIDFETHRRSAVLGLHQVRSRRRWIPGLVAAGAAATVFVAVGLPVLILGGDDASVVNQPQSTVSQIVTTEPIPSIVPAQPSTWSRVADAAVFGGDAGNRVMMDIAASNGVVVAVGADGSADGEVTFDAAVWYSLDGVTWNRVPHDDAVFGREGHQQMNAVVALESGFLAVGSDGDASHRVEDLARSHPENSQSGVSETHAAVWRSEDGVTWTRVPHDEVFSEIDGGAVMNDVAIDGSGLVAVGLVYQRVEPYAIYRWGSGSPSAPIDVDIDVDAAVWRSADGVAWSRVNPVDIAFGGDTVRQSMNAITVGGPGFVAVGHEGFDFLGFDEWTPFARNNTDGRTHVTDNVAAVWTSPDGEAWTRVASDPSMAHSGGAVTGWATMFDVSATGPGLVAVGRDVWVQENQGVAEGAAFWLSTDGLSWQRVAVEGALAGPDMHAITSTSEGVLVAGGGMVLYDSAGTWTSQDDGSTWSSYPHDDILFGGNPVSRVDDEAIGPASIEGLSTFGGNVIAVGSFDGDAAVWIRSLDGIDD